MLQKGRVNKIENTLISDYQAKYQPKRIEMHNEFILKKLEFANGMKFKSMACPNDFERLKDLPSDTSPYIEGQKVDVCNFYVYHPYLPVFGPKIFAGLTWHNSKKGGYQFGRIHGQFFFGFVGILFVYLMFAGGLGKFEFIPMLFWSPVLVLSLHFLEKWYALKMINLHIDKMKADFKACRGDFETLTHEKI